MMPELPSGPRAEELHRAINEACASALDDLPVEQVLAVICQSVGILSVSAIALGLEPREIEACIHVNQALGQRTGHDAMVASGVL